MSRFLLSLLFLSACADDAASVPTDDAASVPTVDGDPATEPSDPASVAPRSPRLTQLSAQVPERHRVCVSDTGAASVAWVDQGEVWASHAPDGRHWAAPSRIDGAAVQPTGLQIACSGSTVAVLWTDGRDSPIQAPAPVLQLHREGQGWLPDVLRLGDAPADAFASAASPAVGLRGSTIWVGWTDNRAGSYDVFLTRSDDLGESWTPGRRLDTGEAGTTFSGDLELLTTATTTVALWSEYSSEGPTVMASVHPFDSTVGVMDGLAGGLACGSADALSLVGLDVPTQQASLLYSTDGGASFSPGEALDYRAWLDCSGLATGQVVLAAAGDPGVLLEVVDGGLSDPIEIGDGPVAEIVVEAGTEHPFVAWTQEFAGQTFVRWSDDAGTTVHDVGSGDQWELQAGSGGGTTVLAFVGSVEEQEGVFALTL